MLKVRGTVQCGSVDWVPPCRPKGCGFDSQQHTRLGSGFLPQSGRVQEATDRSFSLTSVFPSQPLSFLSPLSGINKRKKNFLSFFYYCFNFSSCNLSIQIIQFFLIQFCKIVCFYEFIHFFHVVQFVSKLFTTVSYKLL